MKLKNPIVLIHGLGAKHTYGPIEYFYGLQPWLKENDNQVFTANLKFWHSLEHRGTQLKAQIEDIFPAERFGKLNLVGHSMGGLDARYLTSQLKFSDRVASVTTIGTPNRGTPLADMALGLVPQKAVIKIETYLAALGWSNDGFHQMTKAFHEEVFSVQAPNVDGVAYFSATSAITNPVMKNAMPPFWATHPLLKKLEGDNDGFVSVESATWGEHICTYQGDHYGQIGQLLGHSRGLDYMKFYQEIFGRLAREGF